ncbi:MAG: polysaccharide biosynthesis tyrosine autokinase [Chloroflexi bacterium]|nr:polysaccharide biosynthesis tyrosine autokinase [Chloroflexota bacterium]
MELRKFVAVLLKRLWIIILATVLVGGMTFLLSVTSTTIYSASVTLQIDQGADPRADVYTALRASEASAGTYVEMIGSPVVLRQVIAELQLPFSTGALAGSVSAEQIRDTQLIRINVEDSDPARATATADKIAEVFIRENQARQQARFEGGRREIEQKIKDLEKTIETAQMAIASLGDPTDPQNVNLPEFARTELVRLQSQLSRYETEYVMLIRSQEDFRLAAARYTDNVTVFAPAETPSSPVRPRTLLNTVLGLISGVVLGVSTAFLLEYLDDTVKTGEDLEVLGLALLGHTWRIARVKDLKDALVTAMSSKSHVVEAYRILRANVEFAGFGNPGGTILVTSAQPSEGKSTTVANLGVVAAQAGKRVIVVDSDLRRPVLHRIFGLDREIGLTTLLLEAEPDLDAALQSGGVEGLQVLVSGPIPPNPGDLLGSPQMKQLIARLRERADVVLLDSPPVLAVADASLLAAQASGTILVVDAGETRRDAVRRAKEALDKAEAKVLGAVLNRERRGGRGYGYYYYYYSDEGGREDRRRRGEAAKK